MTGEREFSDGGEGADVRAVGEGGGRGRIRVVSEKPNSATRGVPGEAGGRENVNGGEGHGSGCLFLFPFGEGVLENGLVW